MKAILTILLIASGICSHAQEIDQAIQKRIDASVRIALAALQSQELDTATNEGSITLRRVSKTQYFIGNADATLTTSGNITPAQVSILEANQREINTLREDISKDRIRITALEAKILELTNRLASLKATTIIQ